MSVFVDDRTRLLVQGMTGRDGSFHTRQMVEYGTRVVAGIEWEVPVRYVAGLVSAPLRGPYRRALREALHGARAALEAP